MSICLADLNEALAAALPAHEAIRFGDRGLTFADLAARSRRLAHVLLAHDITIRRERDGLADWESGQDHVALYLYNGNEYLEAMLGAFKARAAPLNVNYRYVHEELVYLLKDADARAVIFHGEFAPVIAEIRHELPRLRLFLQVDDGSGTPLLPGALDYESALAAASDAPPPVRPSPDDLFLLYTGGTTGMPKGVMWRQGDVYVAQMGGAKSDGTPIASIAEAVDRAVRFSGASVLPTPPFMHGAGLYSAFRAFHEGTRVVIQSDPRHFDPDDVLATAEAAGVRMVLLIGDAFGRPILEALRRGRYRLPKLRHFINTGAVLSESVKQGLYEAVPGVAIIDSLGSSETGTQAEIITRAGTPRAKADFAMLDDLSVVVSADARRLLSPGDPDIGWLARRGFLPRGFLGDRAKTEATFPVLDGVRYVVGGDRVRYRADGGLDYLGRDSVTINSGGEKIFAEEVEQALLSHPAVEDVVVAGRPSERWGSEVVAIVALRTGVEADREALLAEAGRHVARYKLPKAFIFVPRIERHPNGKHNYRWARAVVEQAA